MILKINDRAAKAIKDGLKRVELRVYKGDKDYSKLKHGDVLNFVSQNGESFFCKVLEVNHYDSAEELFTLEGTKYTTSSTNDFDTAVENINKIDGYQEAIKEYGIYAIHIEYLYSDQLIWEQLLDKATKIRNDRDVSKMINAGGVGAAILTTGHNIYTGVCIDTASSLGMCAERNAIGTMITNGESQITKLVCVDSKGNLCFPCGACREFLMQLDKDSKDIEILKSINPLAIVKLEELIPEWWGCDRI